MKQFCGEVYHITIRSTAKAVKPRVHFHAGIAVCMEWTANHAAAVWTKTIGFCGLSGGNIQLYDFKYIVVLECWPPLQFYAMTALLWFGVCLLTLIDFFLPPMQLL